MKEIMTKLYEKGKRPLSLLLVIIMMLSMVNLTKIFATDTFDFSKNKDNSIVGEYNSLTKTMTITGSGALTTYITDFTEMPEDVETLIIDEGFTSIGDNMFKNEAYDTLILPTSVDSIGKQAFMYSTVRRLVNNANNSQTFGTNCLMLNSVESIELYSTNTSMLSWAEQQEKTNIKLIDKPEAINIWVQENSNTIYTIFYESGMTWNDWVSSDYNTKGYTLDANPLYGNVVMVNETEGLVNNYLRYGDEVTKEDVIYGEDEIVKGDGLNPDYYEFTIPQPRRFTIDAKEYVAEDSSWVKWLNSEFNTDNFEAWKPVKDSTGMVHTLIGNRDNRTVIGFESFSSDPSFDNLADSGNYDYISGPYVSYSLDDVLYYIGFSIDAKPYLVEKSTTWTTFVNDNSDEYMIVEDTIVSKETNAAVMYMNSVVSLSNAIIDDAEYVTNQPTVEFTVNGNPYSANEGATWESFIASHSDEFNKNGSNVNYISALDTIKDPDTGLEVYYWNTIEAKDYITDTSISFTVDGTLYTISKSYTWNNYIYNSSETGHNDFSVSYPDIVKSNTTYESLKLNGVEVKSSDMIVDGGIYKSVEKLNFTIDGTPYTASPNTTWYTWVYGEGASQGFSGSLMNDNVYETTTNKIVNYNGYPVNMYSEIIDGAAYELKAKVYNMYIDDTMYEFGQDEYGNNMTWEKWVESSYNTDNIKINPSNNEVELLDGTPVCMSGSPVHSYETIYEQKYTAKNITFSVNYESLISSDNSTWQNWLGTSNNINNYTTDNTNVYDNYGDKILQPVTHIPVTVGDNIIKNTRYVTQISFFIDEQEYEGYSDYTWLDWVSSDFNTDNKFSINKDGLLVDNLGNKVGQIQWDNSVIYENSYSQLQRDIHYSILYNQETTVEFMIDSVTYEKYDYMTWSEWLESDFNTDGFTIGNYDAYSQGVLSSVGNVVCHYDFTYDGSWLWTVGLQENIVTDKNYQTFAPIAPQFHIGSNTYFMNEGQMWMDWLRSPANTDNYLYGYSDEKGMGIYVTLDGTNYIVTDMGTMVQRENQITKDYTYSLEVINGEISELIEFWVEGNQLYAKKDMPWNEWISSSFNTVGYTLDGENIKDGDRVLYYRDWSSSTSGTPESLLVVKTDIIDNHFEYLFEDTPNGDIEKIKFNIETTSYEAETDMSWSSWVSSTYGKGFSIVESDAYGQVVVDTAGHVVLENDNSTPVTVMGIIASGGQYYLSDYVVDNGNTDDPGSDVTNPPKDESTYIIVDAEPTMFKVQVPIKIDVSMDTEGTVTTGSGYTVDNLCAMGPVVIENIKVTTATNWKLSDFNADYANMKVSSRVIGLQINGVNVETDGSVIMNDSLSSVIRHAESKELTFAAKLPAQKTGIQENAAAVIFTVDFDKV